MIRALLLEQKWDPCEYLLRWRQQGKVRGRYRGCFCIRRLPLTIHHIFSTDSSAYPSGSSRSAQQNGSCGHGSHSSWTTIDEFAATAATAASTVHSHRKGFLFHQQLDVVHNNSTTVDAPLLLIRLCQQLRTRSINAFPVNFRRLYNTICMVSNLL